MALLPDAWLVSPAMIVEDTSEAAKERARAQLGSSDPALLAAVYSEHGPGIRRFLQGLLGDRAAADDALQETFARAFRRMDTLRDPARIAPWLFGIARNVALEARKARRRIGRLLDPGQSADGELHEDHQGSDHRTPEADLLGREAAGVVDRALGQLSTDRRAVLMLRVDHGLSYDDIAGLMGWTLAKVKIEIHRAREVLREELCGYEGGSR
ncbi:MAG: RNA polymerase sigma factor [Byssovorax sp.]